MRWFLYAVRMGSTAETAFDRPLERIPYTHKQPNATSSRADAIGGLVRCLRIHRLHHLLESPVLPVSPVVFFLFFVSGELLALDTVLRNPSAGTLR
jgi:hypothetical protein